MKKMGFVVVLMWAFTVAGCGANRLVVGQSFSETVPQIKKVGVILSDVSVQEVSVCGARSLMAEETAKAVPVVAKVAVESVAGLNMDAKLIRLDEDVRKLTAPFNRIRREELYMMLGDREARPVASDLTSLAVRTDVDAFVLVRSCENESSVGRKVLKAAVVLLGGFAGSEMTYADISILDRNGRLLYFNHSATGDSLKSESDVRDMFDGLLDGFREASKKIQMHSRNIHPMTALK